PNTPRYGNRTRTITHRALPHPDMSCRRNRSLKTTMSSQNHTTNRNIVTTSVRKLAKLKPPSAGIDCPPYAISKATIVRDRRGVQRTEPLTQSFLGSMPPERIAAESSRPFALTAKRVAKVRGVLEPLSAMAERNFSKAGVATGAKALHRFIGSNLC